MTNHRADQCPELLTNQQMGMADRLAITSASTNGHGPTEFELLCTAGAEVARHVSSRYPVSLRVLVLCGPGNNGGDGYIAARVLADLGYAVRLISVADGKSGLLQQAQNHWGRSIERSALVDKETELANCDLVIDAMFGAGLKRALTDEPLAWIHALRGKKLAVVAVDVPSGLNADDGLAVGGLSVQATSTITFFRLKPGHVLYPGRALCGDIDVVDIGIDRSVLDTIKPSTYLNLPGYWGQHFPRSDHSQHKFHRGHTLVFSGPMHATGAARLSARGALRIGSGLVTLATPVDAVPVVAAQLTAIMIAPWQSIQDATGLIADPRINSVLIGPGFGVGKPVCELILALLSMQSGRNMQSKPPALVLDADALTSFADRRDELFSAIASYKADVVLTPHDGEYNRLFDCDGSRLDRACHAAAKSGAIVVLKGPDTVVATADGKATINDSAPPALATAGSGDVLAGFISGLLAQDMSGFAAASAAVWLHGQCAYQFGKGLIAEDLPEQLPAVLAELQTS